MSRCDACSPLWNLCQIPARETLSFRRILDPAPFRFIRLRRIDAQGHAIGGDEYADSGSESFGFKHGSDRAYQSFFIRVSAHGLLSGKVELKNALCRNATALRIMPRNG